MSGDAALTDRVNVWKGGCLMTEQDLVNCSRIEEGTFTDYVIGGGKRYIDRVKKLLAHIVSS